MNEVHYTVSRLIKFGFTETHLADFVRCAKRRRRLPNGEATFVVDLDSDCWSALYERWKGKKWDMPKRPDPPKKRKPWRWPKLKPGPGTVVKWGLWCLGYRVVNDGVICANGKKIGSCGCNRFKQRMNLIGYVGCWKARREIIHWFREKRAACDE